MIHKPGKSGQSMVIMAVAVAALIALAALIIDGGSSYLNRRQAQTAADAAAMAGAYSMCVEDLDPTAAANQYATNNGAVAESVSVDADNQVVVQTRVETDSFLASVLGRDTDVAKAQASAGCFKPGMTENMLPIAWTCRPTVGGVPQPGCQLHPIPWDVFKVLQTTVTFGNAGAVVLDPGDGEHASTYTDGAPTGQKMAYLVMDKTVDAAADCAPPIGTGTYICDLNGDGTNDVTGANDRGWLALSGTGANDLVDLMLNGYSEPIEIPQWFPAHTGAITNLFIKAHQIQGHVVIIPVFNAMCGNTTEAQLAADCPSEYETGDLIREDSGNGDWYRVAGFAPFVVTCVSKGASENCPAKTFTNVKKSISTIEGYFVSGYVGGSDICEDCYDLGIYIISLTK